MQLDKEAKIIGINGQIVEVEFDLNYQPSIRDVLCLKEDTSTKLEIVTTSGKNSYFCLSLNNLHKLGKGKIVVNTEKRLLVPAGDEVLGRAFDIFGNSFDQKPPLSTKSYIDINEDIDISLDDVMVSSSVLETGIKAIDFLHQL